ncbi:MAG: hypothetical protein RLY99_1057 [Pseudomonadota bacterium]|jgi:hypothetical protein
MNYLSELSDICRMIQLIPSYLLDVEQIAFI